MDHSPKPARPWCRDQPQRHTGQEALAGGQGSPSRQDRHLEGVWIPAVPEKGIAPTARPLCCPGPAFCYPSSRCLPSASTSVTRLTDGRMNYRTCCRDSMPRATVGCTLKRRRAKPTPSPSSTVTMFYKVNCTPRCQYVEIRIFGIFFAANSIEGAVWRFAVCFRWVQIPPLRGAL